ncbi:two-component system, chemotaxis family, response regulator CheB [Paenibacillus sophorae]|uniref:Protein-glutamate methylesterase/protein-glutamine glutaminase n=1 Tax=Paenibacillus sophorae TaxID=1333845 RepID=A0A1H8GA96_9BACL|nr:chemotaxis response regulator protein-glutamate methylesterase [Paenibacillus sophorae]QWU14158.1 chemotaxis-specific protein-glutamate methyltransferase CheB [Paenibacillus sophorae]SEN40956.1 two-component system, chemotaxis family, response regulator CheB [Paenibacillus sophorae]
MKPYKVLVVDDSAFMRKIISDLIEKDADFQVTATAVNGRQAVDKVKELQPDLVTMDVEMPEMNGLEALKLIMLDHPLPVIMLSGINEEGMKETILALEGGAFDFIRKPSVSSSHDINSVGESLREQMKEAMLARERREARSASALLSTEGPPALQPPEPASSAPPFKLADKPDEGAAEQMPSREMKDIKAPIIRPPSPDTGKPAQSKRADKPPLPRSERTKSVPPRAKPEVGRIKTLSQQNSDVPSDLASPKPPIAGAAPGIPTVAGRDRKIGAKGLEKLVAVGCSTGGPRALKALLENIPADFPAPIVIVQHMPPNFTKSLAQRLNTFSPLDVMEAEQGMILRKGAAYIAPGGYHMKVMETAGGQYAVNLSKEEARNGHRPSVDTLFESLLPLKALERHAVIMTGMGSDGARMMKSLYEAGITSTFAESEETCVVYGMPRSAVELQCVSYILPLQDIAPRLVQVVK